MEVIEDAGRGVLFNVEPPLNASTVMIICN